MNASPLRDKRVGRRLALTGGARILQEAERAPTNSERIARWRIVTARLPFEATVTPIKRTPK